MDNLNYPYLLAVHTVCVDGQIHQRELQLLQSLAQKIGVDSASETEADLILAQADQHLGLKTVIQRIHPTHRTRAFSLSVLAAQFDGFFDQAEQELLEQLKQRWNINDDSYNKMQAIAHKESQRLIAGARTVAHTDLSTIARMVGGLEDILGKTVVDHVVKTVPSVSIRESIQNYRIEALLSGSKYGKAIEECRNVGLSDIKVVDTCLCATSSALLEIGKILDSKITEINAQVGQKPAQAAREALRSMKDDRAEIERVINQELQELEKLQIKKRRAMDFYTIAFMGRSKAGKSTLHAVVTGGGWDQIGVGRQNTTRLNRVYEWQNIRIVDTPGIATPGGEELEKVAESIIDEADLVCFVVTNNNQQTSEFEFLKQLRSKGKPLLILLNVKEDLSHPVRRKRFLEKPNQVFSDDKDRLGGHIDRIRRDAAEHYGTSNFPIIPVQLLAAQIAQQQPEDKHAADLMKASRLHQFLDSVRLSLLNEGSLRRSQNLLGSTVADIERLCHAMKARSGFYLGFSRQIRDQAKESVQRLKKSQADHARQLEQDLRRIFADLRHEIPDFASTHWDNSESKLNNAWSTKVRRFGLEEKINLSQEKSMAAFANDMNDLLEEVNQEINLQRKLSYSSEKLNEQDSSVWFGKVLKWGSSLAALGTSVAILTNFWNPAGWVMGVIAVVGILSSFFESKETKKRKAVANITKALESQIDNQESQIIEAALRSFREQCVIGATAVQDYFLLSAQGLDFFSETLGRGTEILQTQVNTLNTHFAARILDFSSKKPSESSAQALRNHIHKVSRTVGKSINIKVSRQMQIPKDLSAIESIIQENITLQQIGV